MLTQLFGYAILQDEKGRVYYGSSNKKPTRKRFNKDSING